MHDAPSLALVEKQGKKETHLGRPLERQKERNAFCSRSKPRKHGNVKSHLDVNIFLNKIFSFTRIDTTLVRQATVCIGVLSPATLQSLYKQFPKKFCIP